MASMVAAGAEVLQKGALIGRYVVLGLIGRGGMGEVYAAYDPELDRKVAVKLLRGRASRGPDDEGRVRLLREAQAIAKLSHPNVIVVYDVGTFGDSVFIAMEFIDGTTLGYWLQAETRPWREVLKVFVAAGRGLMAAHGAGMVHRDFKPDNAMLTKDGQVRVMDFGLARQLGEAETRPPQTVSGSFKNADLQQLMHLSDESVEPDLDATARLGPGAGGSASAPASPSGSYLHQKLTQTGALVGTPAYMAPEQFAATASDARTDQFAFCIALYEGLYGRRPFDGDSVLSLMANVVSGTINPAPAGTTVPARLRKVLLRGLQVDPEQRYPTMADLLAALEADPSSKRRRWLGAVATAAVGAALVLGIRRPSLETPRVCAGATGRLADVWEPGLDSPRKQAMRRVFQATGKTSAMTTFASVSGLLDRYAGAWAAMYGESCEATQVRGEQSADVLDLRMACLGDRLSSLRALTDILASADTKVMDNAVSAAGALPTLDRCADVPLLRAVVQPPADQTVRAKVEAVRQDVARARALFDSGQCAAALGVARSAVEAAKRTDYLPVKAEALFVAGRFGDFCSDQKEAVADLEEAVWAAEASNHHEVVAEASNFLVGEYADRQHDVRTARLWAHHAEATLAKFQGLPLLKAYLAVEWGQIYQAEGNHEEAIRQQRMALEIKERVLGPRHPDTGLSLMNVGLALHELGDDAAAEPVSRQAVEVIDGVLGPESVQTAIALLDCGEVLRARGRLDEARKAFARAIKIWKDAGASPFFIAYGQFDLGQVALIQKQPAEARTLLSGAAAELGKQDAVVGAQARFYLAQSMWETRKDRKDALALAKSSRKAMVVASAPSARVAEVDTWLTGHAVR
jgi:serine/threonine protein kinase/tetratricopeptide (TPR) repeat protein